MVVRSLMPKAYRTTGIRRHQDVCLSLFQLEYHVSSHEHETRFYVTTVRAANLNEAKRVLNSWLVRQRLIMVELVRQYDFGKDRAWLHGVNTYKEELIETKWYDREIYERTKRR